MDIPTQCRSEIGISNPQPWVSFCSTSTTSTNFLHNDTSRVMSLATLSFPPLPSQDPPSTPSEPISAPQSPSSPTSPSHISHSASSSVSTTSEAEDDEAQREWQESLAQLTLLFNLVLLPFIGKYFGRKFAYFSIFPTPDCLYPQFQGSFKRHALCFHCQGCW